MDNQEALDDIKKFLNSTEGQALSNKVLADQEKAWKISLEMCKSMGILCPGMITEVNGKTYRVLQTAHDKLPGYFLVCPLLPEDSEESLLAPLQVLFHAPTAHYAQKILADPNEALGRILGMAAEIIGSPG